MKGKKAKSRMVMKPKKKNQKPKLNVTLHEDAKQKLAALARLEKRSVSNLIEVMADERWERLAEREGVDYAKTVADKGDMTATNSREELAFRRKAHGRKSPSGSEISSRTPSWVIAKSKRRSAWVISA